MLPLVASSACARIDHSLGCNQPDVAVQPTVEVFVDRATRLTFGAEVSAVTMPQPASMLALRSPQFLSSLIYEFASLQKTYRIRSDQ